MTIAASSAESRCLRKLPKAELHIHLEGAMRPATLTELCQKHQVPRPDDTGGKRFADFGPFAACYMAVCECLREEADLFRLVREVAEDAAAAGASWIEPALSLVLYCDRFGGLEGTLKILLRAAATAEESTGVGIGFIVAAERHLPPSEAESLARAVHGMVSRGEHMIGGRPGVVAFGLHSAEPGNPPEPFAEAFRIACGDGTLAAIPHAGELEPAPGQGPTSVRYCAMDLGAKRIGHGVLAAPDPQLLRELAAKGVCLDVCPTSNLLLRVVETIEAHPLPSLLRAGVPCTVNSDDPLLFGCTLLGEFELCRADLGMDDESLAACARNSFTYSCAPEDLKQRGIAGIDAWLAAPGDGHADKRLRSAP
eukprot:CAMPEP_0203918304 /NCGR_PEP_ID=MMETSP0359-20131031/58835_1 /ASSEMBLY_ACC=CAM_ASM_000338 /TAXON_ID=268821 /ORGANISM="Scrippsiella Hangoei, Strain SHTV-5" /LENGTH=366 /DNA_ID=CAMNT_0050845363 /DNA_START=95 /DNA_END=1195 /DNA_ORIENTATION=-